MIFGDLSAGEYQAGSSRPRRSGRRPCASLRRSLRDGRDNASLPTTEQLRWIIKKHGHNVTVLFCRSLGLGDVPAPPGLTLRIYNITRQAGCQALAALLPARRDTIERQGESRAPSLPFEGCKRAPGAVAQRPPPPKRARADKARADRRPTGGGPSARQQEQGSAPPNGRHAPRITRHRAETCTPVPAAADRRAFRPPQFPARVRDGNYRRKRAGTTKRQAPTTTTQPGTLEE